MVVTFAIGSFYFLFIYCFLVLINVKDLSSLFAQRQTSLLVKSLRYNGMQWKPVRLGKFVGAGEDFSIIWAVVKSLGQHEQFFLFFSPFWEDRSMGKKGIGCEQEKARN